MSTIDEKNAVRTNEYFELIDTLIEKIKASDIKFDCVVGIVRGGYIPADAISRALDIPLNLVWAKSYSGKTQGEIKVLGTIAPDLKGNILLVDDLVDSGKTLIAMRDYYKILNHEVKTAVLWKKEQSAVDPDFFAIEVGNEWITQPLEAYEL